MCILHVKNCVLNKKIRFPYQFLIKNLVLLPPPELLFITQIPTHYFCSIANMKCDIFLLLLLLLVAVEVVFWHGMQNDSIHDLCDRELVYNLAYCAIIWSMWYKSETQSNAVFSCAIQFAASIRNEKKMNRNLCFLPLTSILPCLTLHGSIETRIVLLCFALNSIARQRHIHLLSRCVCINHPKLSPIKQYILGL